MADVFISYARPDEPIAKRVADALSAAGYRVWRDDELPAHRAYAEVIEERLKAAKAVVVLWSADAAKSQWVRAEADVGAGRRHARPGRASTARSRRCRSTRSSARTCRTGTGSSDSPGWRKLASSVEALAGPPARGSGEDARRPAREQVVGLRASLRST